MKNEIIDKKNTVYLIRLDDQYLVGKYVDEELVNRRYFTEYDEALKYYDEITE